LTSHEYKIVIVYFILSWKRKEKKKEKETPVIFYLSK
jgi:hypothetical protein